MRLLARVHQDVPGQVLTLEERLAAGVADVRSLVAVGQHVAHEVRLAGVRLVAQVALEVPFGVVGLGVLDQVGALGEGLAADGAHERSGTGVHPDVVRQVCRRDEPYKIRATKDSVWEYTYFLSDNREP